MRFVRAIGINQSLVKISGLGRMMGGSGQSRHDKRTCDKEEKGD